MSGSVVNFSISGKNSKTDYIYLVTMSNIPTSYYFQHHSCSLVDLFYPVCRLSFKFRGFRVTLVAMLNNYSCSVPHTYLWFLFCKQFTEICDSDQTKGTLYSIPWKLKSLYINSQPTCIGLSILYCTYTGRGISFDGTEFF